MLLGIKNYKELYEYYKYSCNKELMSPLTYLFWSFYSYEIRFEIIDDGCILYGLNKADNRWEGFEPMCHMDDYKDLCITTVNRVQELNGGAQEKKLIWVLEENLSNFSEYEEINSLRVHYLYDMNRMRDFSGSDLQKKRNNLNYFVKNFESKCECIILDKNNIDSFDEQMEKLFNLEGQINPSEREIYYVLKSLFKTDNLIGLVVMVDGKLSAVTICQEKKNDIMEIFFEKADKEYRGLYQYLITNNIKLNEVKSVIMDREDDNNVEAIRMSKESYRPSRIIVKKLIKWNK
jgi:hypothetical protein